MTVDKKLVQSKYDKAFESLEEAKILFEVKHYNTVINRLYYAFYYAATASLLNVDVVSKTHSGTKAQFNLNFIKTKKISEDFGILYSRLFSERSESDYGDFANFSKKETEPLIAATAICLTEIKLLLNY